MDICRAFGVPLWLIQSQEKETAWGSGIEHMGIAFVIYTMGLYFSATEQAVRRSLMTSEERARLQMKFNVSALLRGDFKTRMDGYQLAIQNGIRTPNEIRALEDLSPREDGLGDRFYRPANIVPDAETPVVVAPRNGQNGAVQRAAA